MSYVDTRTREEKIAAWQKRQAERLAYAERCAIRDAKLKAFADERGWVSKYCGVRQLIPGRTNDWECRPPHDDHGYGFYQAGKGGKPVAYVSQPYCSTIVEFQSKMQTEMQTWAAQHGLKVEFPDVVSWHNDSCMVCVYTRDYTTSLWKAVERYGEKWVVGILRRLPFFSKNPQFVEPENYGYYVELYLQHAAENNIKRLKSTWIFHPAAKIIIESWCRGMPVAELKPNMIRAVVIADPQ